MEEVEKTSELEVLSDSKTDELALPENVRNFVARHLAPKAAVLAGLFQNDKSQNIALVSRLFQAFAQGDLRHQFFKEIIDLYQKGQIKEDFCADVKSRGFRSFVEILKFLDSEEALDTEKLEVLKRIFFKIIQTGIPEEEQVLKYQLLQAVKELSSEELLIMAANYRLFKRKVEFNGNYDHWVRLIANELKHGIMGLVAKHEEKLERMMLVGGRTHSDRSGVANQAELRLTDLGIKLGQFLTDGDV